MNNILIDKLDAFIRKYYYNQLLKGLIFFLISISGIFIFINFTEYFSELGSQARFILLILWILLNASAFIVFIAIPLLKLNRIGKVLSYKEASIIIGKHFSNIQDKLLNALLLQEMALHNQNELLLESINQKTNELSPVSFSSIIQYSKNTKYLRWLVPPVLLIILILLFWPEVFTSSTKHIIYYNQSFYTPPFLLEIQNSELKALQNENFTLSVKVRGQKIPDNIFIKMENNEFVLDKVSNRGEFKYTFKSPQKDILFKLKTLDFETNDYTLKVLPKPSIQSFSLKLHFPKYLNKNDEKVSNTGDIIIPEGTLVEWNFHTLSTNELFIYFNDSSFQLPITASYITFQKRFKQNTQYIVAGKNKYINYPVDSIHFNITVIPDQYPSITVTQQKDSGSVQFNPSFFGTIKDDYGLTKLLFHATIYTQDSLLNKTEKHIDEYINISKMPNQIFNYFINPDKFADTKPGDKIEYYFEVYDNDGVNGPKKTRSEILTHTIPSSSQIAQNIEANNDQIKHELKENINQAKQVQKDLQTLYKKILDKKQVSFEDKKSLQNILQKQKSIQQNIEELKNKLNHNNEMQNQLQYNEDLAKKYEEIEKLLNDMMTPEMKKMMEELEQLMNKMMDKNLMEQKIEEMKLNTKDLEKELDRTLEIFKQFELEQKMENNIQKLNELIQQQEKLSDETSDKKNNTQDLQQKQQELSNQFDNLKKDLKEMEQMNQSMEKPNELPNTESMQKDISNEQSQSQEQLKNNNKPNSSSHQKKAAQKMKEMKQSLQNSLNQMQQEQQAENEDNIKQLLDNLLTLSFQQEELIQTIQKTKTTDPKYSQIARNQKKLSDAAKLIEDSLFSMSKRNPSISATLNKEITQIQYNMNQTANQITEHNSAMAAMYMQKSFTSINNLALMLNDALEQLQNQMKNPNNMPGSGSCKKPGSGKGQKPSVQPSKPKLSDLQKQLNEQLKKMKEGMQKGNQNKGQFPSSGSMAEQLAKMAAQQEFLKEQLKEMIQKLKNKGKNPGGDISNMMEETEKDIVNNRITEQTIKRQQEIVTRLLESEKALREQDESEQRESKEPKNAKISNQNQILEYNKLKSKELEDLQNTSIPFKPFYKEKIQTYFNTIQ